MFKRCKTAFSVKCALGTLLILLAIIFTPLDNVIAQQATITIDSLPNQAAGMNSWVDVTLEPMGETFAPRYIQLVIGTEDLPVFIEPGAKLNQCVWFLYYHSVPNTECSFGYCPPYLTYIRIFNSTNGYGSLDCPFTEPTVLLRMRLSPEGNVGEFHPLRFVWTDCGDNAAIVVGADSIPNIVMSDQVFDFNGNNVTLDQPFFTRTGAPSSCLDPMLDTARVRGINFRSGGIQLSYVDSTVSEPRAVVSIGKVNNVDFGSVHDISIDLSYSPTSPDSLDIAGFDFLLSYEPGALTLLAVAQGQLLTDCGWENFTYRNDSAGFIRLVGVADIINGDVHPSCLAGNPGQLANLTFQTTTDTAYYQCSDSPVRFLWADCGDNSLSETTGDTLFISNRVMDYSSFIITANDTIPSIYGAPTECLVNSGPNQLLRSVNFWDGRVGFTCFDSIDDRGDLNLNGIPYEIADWVLFSNYSFYGLTVFTTNFEAQSAASDVNIDGLELTFWDLMYLYRVIIGDALPYPSPDKAAVGDTVILAQDTLTNTVTVNYAGNLSALMFYFDDSVNITTTLPHSTVSSYFDGSLTRAMVFPTLGDSIVLPLIPDGRVFAWEGDAQLIDALAAYNGTTYLEAKVTGGTGWSACCSIRGDVDDSGDIPQISDLVALVSYLFGDVGSFVPPCPEQANVDGLSGTGGPVDLSDLTYLVDYLFRGGAPIPACIAP